MDDAGPAPLAQVPPPQVQGAPFRPGGRWLDNEHTALRHCWHPVALSTEVTGTPRRVWLVGEPLVVVRLRGEATVLSDHCPHRSAPLSAGTVVDGELECAYHGWRFDGGGSCTAVPSAGPGGAIPSRACAGRPWGVLERDGLVFVALDEPVVDLPDLPAPSDGSEEDARTVVLGPYEGRYGAALLIDNQIDVSHFAFLHQGTFGNSEARQTAPHRVERRQWGFATDLDIPITAGNDPLVATGDHPLDQHRRMGYRYRVPFHLVLRLEYPVMGGTSTIVFWAQPQTAERSRLYVTLRLWQPGGFTDTELADRLAFEERVTQEDLSLQARFDHLALPLDTTVECHVRSDRASLEYRRLLGDLVDEVGRRTGAGRERPGPGTDRTRGLPLVLEPS